MIDAPMERAPSGTLPLIEALGSRLGELHRNGRRPVLVVDEAQLARPSLLEEIRLLTKHEDRQDKHLPTARSARERVRARTGQLDILLFRVGEERFAVDLGAIEEAIDIPAIHHVPEMPPAMLGVITVRGTLTSMYSPAAALGLSLHDGTSALIIRRGRSRVGVVVDEVDDVTSLDLSQLRDAPVLDAGDGIVLGVVRQRDSLFALVDIDALLAACQAASLLETA